MIDTVELLVLVALGAAMVASGLLVVRRVRILRAIRRDRLAVPADPRPLVTSAASPPSRGPAPAGAPDAWLDALVVGAGLEMTPRQAAAVLGLAAVAGGLMVAVLLPRPELVAAGLVAGGLAPVAAWLALGARRRGRMRDQLPDAFFRIARSLRAGTTLARALALGAEQTPAPLGVELRRVAVQLDLGLSATFALESLARRVALADFDAFVAAVALQQETGGNLARLVERVAVGARDRQEFRGYVRSATTLGRTTAIFIAAAQPAILVMYLLTQPEFIRDFFRSETGRIAFAVSIALEVIGAIWLFRILDIDDS